MSLFENFPYTNLHELNLDWLVDQLNKISESSVLSVNGQTGIVTLYENYQMVLPNVPEDNWTLIRMCDGTYRGILFGNDDKAYIVHGGLMAQIYSQNNPPPYPVTRVNGMYGDVELYTEQYVRLPDLDDAQMTSWTFFRMLNNKSHGIEFKDNGTAMIINGTQRYTIYTANDQPPYPVDSVNGQTGLVVLFTDTNGNVAYPNFDDPNYSGWSVNRSVNGTNLGLEFDSNGDLLLKVGASTYHVYTSRDPQANYVTDPSDSTQVIAQDSTDDYWALMRETSEGYVGIMFSNTLQDSPEVYLAYIDSNNVRQNVKLVTVDDLPATGVVSVNTKSGIVTLYGDDIEMNLSDSRKVDEAIADTTSLIAILEMTNTATHNITSGQYVIWNNALYVATSNITLGDTLSLSNLSAVSKTVYDHINDIKSDMASVNFGNGYETIADIESALDGLNAAMVGGEYRFITFGCGNISKPFTPYKTYCGYIMRINANNYAATMINNNGEEVRVSYQNGSRYVIGDPELEGFAADDNSITTLAELTAYLAAHSTNNLMIVGVNPTVLSALLGVTTTRAGFVAMLKASSANTYYFCFENQRAAVGNYNTSTNTATPVLLT